MVDSIKVLPDLLTEAPTHPNLLDARHKKDPKTNDPYLLSEDVEDGRIRVLTMNRLKAKNGFDDWLYLVIADALNQAAKDENVLVVVLTGVGDFFSSGADLRAEAAGGQGLKLSNGNIYDPVGVFMRTFLRFPKPIVAAVNGPAIGVGCTMIPHCDLVYASDKASFLVPFSRIAVVPEFCSCSTFPQILGTSTANEMILLGKQLSVKRAKELGFVSEIFPHNELLQRTLQEIKSGLVYPLLERTLPLFKNMIKKWNIDELERLCMYELKKLDERVESGEIAEAVLTFMQNSRKDKASL